MKNLLLISLFLITSITFGQKNALELQKAQEQINSYGDVYFKFSVENSLDIQSLPKYISIDNVSRKEVNIVYAYVHKTKFANLLALNIPFEVVSKQKNTKAITMATSVAEMANWDRYPTYSVYQQMMQEFVTNYPSLCRLESIGTSQGGRDISVLKITDNPDVDENEPEFFYTSTMHGDETVGFVLTLRLIDYLLSNYGSDSQVDNLVNNVEIWINPNANPDGTYNAGNHTVAGATRYTNNGIDLNRNFPAPQDAHPDGNAWALENIDQMAFADEHNIVLSANMHGGAEVVNYPWDSWYSSDRVHADDDWWEFVSREYADTVHANSSGYMTGFNNGITFGADWYLIWGGRQDYMTYFKQGREFTLELSDTKLLGTEYLQAHWNYNYQSLLLYLDQSLYGIHGIITDAVSGNPIEAKVEISGHDDDVSFVNSHLPIGDYHRLIHAGTYDVTYSKAGYHSQTITTNVINHDSVIQDVALVPVNAGINDEIFSNAISLSPNPTDKGVTSIVFDDSFDQVSVSIYDNLGRIVHSNYVGSVNSGQQLAIDLSGTMQTGIYFVKITSSEGNAVKRLIKT